MRIAANRDLLIEIKLMLNLLLKNCQPLSSPIRVASPSGEAELVISWNTRRVNHLGKTVHKKNVRAYQNCAKNPTNDALFFSARPKDNKLEENGNLPTNRHLTSSSASFQRPQLTQTPVGVQTTVEGRHEPWATMDGTCLQNDGTSTVPPGASSPKPIFDL